MGDIVQTRNIGAYVTQRIASSNLAVTAAGAGDNTTKNGLTIDRETVGLGSLPDSALFSVLFGATLASGATISIAQTVQDSADNSSWSDYATSASAVVGTGPSGGGAVTGQAVLAVNLTSARRYVRANFLPDLSAAGTDTAVLIGAAALAGFDRLAAPS